MKRNELNTIGDGLLNSFISRNNDVQGYWGIGKLLNLYIENNRSPIYIDLIGKQIDPDHNEFKTMINLYSNRLNDMCDNRSVPSEFVLSAKIKISVTLNDNSKHYSFGVPHKMTCEIDIIDDLGQSHHSIKQVWCREHDPKRESKSSRVY